MKWLGRLRTLRKLREGAQRREMRAEMQAAPRYTRSGPRRIYLHARAEDAPLCQQVRNRLLEVRFDPAIDVTIRGEELADWRREQETNSHTASGTESRSNPPRRDLARLSPVEKDRAGVGLEIEEACFDEPPTGRADIMQRVPAREDRSASASDRRAA
jgi:hypothetical protein